jgi:hypothetical protein
MIDVFVLLTPILLLGVIALLGFIGCNQVFGVDEVELEVEVTGVSPTSGPTQGGQQVVVTGSFFDTSPAVTFGGIAATVTQASSGIIVVETPPHSSGDVDVVVTNADGNSGTLLSTALVHYTYAAVANAGSTIVPGQPAGSAQASVAFAGSPKLIVVTVLYETGFNVSLTVTGGTFGPAIKSDLWSSYKIETFYAPMVPPGPNVMITATLSGATVNFWYLCVTVYDNADQNTPVYAPNSLNSISSSMITPLTIQAQQASDLIYSVAIALTSGGSFITVGSLSPGAGFQVEANNGSVMLQDQQASVAGAITATAGTTGTNTGRWYLLAMGIKHA